MKCDNCTEKCPQEELACEIAKGRLYATEEVIRLQKKLERQRQEIRNKTVDKFAEKLKDRLVRRYANASVMKQYVAMQVTSWCNEISSNMKEGDANG